MLRSLGAAQTVPVRGDVDANVSQHVQLVRAASQAGARVLVFPELSLTGYELDLAPSLAFSERDARLAPLVESASSFSIFLVVGAPVRIQTRLHIGAFILSPDGAIEIYTKHHLGAFSPGDARDGIVPPPEASVFEPGERSPLISIDGHTAAVAVCADTSRPSHPRAAAERGAGTYLASTFVIPSDLDRDAARFESYAARHSMAVVFSNYGGPSGGLPAAGRSTIWSETGEILGRLEPAGAGVLVVTDDPNGPRAQAILLDGV